MTCASRFLSGLAIAFAVCLVLPLAPAAADGMVESPKVRVQVTFTGIAKYTTDYTFAIIRENAGETAEFTIVGEGSPVSLASQRLFSTLIPKRVVLVAAAGKMPDFAAAAASNSADLQPAPMPAIAEGVVWLRAHAVATLDGTNIFPRVREWTHGAQLQRVTYEVSFDPNSKSAPLVLRKTYEADVNGAGQIIREAHFDADNPSSVATEGPAANAHPTATADVASSPVSMPGSSPTSAPSAAGNGADDPARTPTGLLLALVGLAAIGLGIGLIVVRGGSN